MNIETDLTPDLAGDYYNTEGAPFPLIGIPMQFRKELDMKALKRLVRVAESVALYSPWVGAAAAVQKASMLSIADLMEGDDVALATFDGQQLLILSITQRI